MVTATTTHLTKQETRFLEALSACATFRARLDLVYRSAYPLVGQGSGRTVLQIHPKRVAKIAKNAKGIAQNAAEANYYASQQYGGVLAKVLANDDDDTWLVQQAVTKTSKKAIQKYFGVSLEEIGKYMGFHCYPYRGALGAWYQPQDATTKRFAASQRLSSLIDCALNCDWHCGDMGRVSSWGMLGKRIVLCDYGLTRSNYETYYQRKRPTRHW